MAKPKTTSSVKNLLDLSHKAETSGEAAPAREGDEGDADNPHGARLLREGMDVWKHNAWDHVELPEEQEALIATILEKQRAAPVPDAERDAYNTCPERYWDTFYERNQNRFFKDRNWLRNEFPELIDATMTDAGPMKVVEVGCGAGNTVFPLLAQNQNPDLVIHACDYSKTAIDVVKSNPLYLSPPMGKCHASVWDLASSANSVSGGAPGKRRHVPNLPEGVELGTVDIVVMIYVFSALRPEEWKGAVKNVWTMLRPGGVVLFRDYGRHDLPQLRFKAGRLLAENFYVRGDGTRVYFFDKDELGDLWGGEPDVASMAARRAREQAASSLQTPAAEGMATLSAHLASRLSLSTSDVPVPTPDGHSPLLTPAESAVESGELLTAATGTSEAESEKGGDGPEAEVTTLNPQPATAASFPKPYLRSSPDEVSLPPKRIVSPPPRDGPKLPSLSDTSTPSAEVRENGPFRLTQLAVDRRLQVNRAKRLRMFRCWMQLAAWKRAEYVWEDDEEE